MKKTGLFILAILAAAAPVAYAQGPPQGPPPPGPAGPGFGGAELLGFEGMLGGKVVSGAPFSAVGTSQTTQTLSEGTHITRTMTVTIYRDSQGRVRREGNLSGIGPLQTWGQPTKFIAISDPVAGARYRLDPEKKVAHKLPLGPGARGLRGTGGPGGFGQRPNRPGAANAQTESLGTQTVAGVKAEGTRVTRTVPAGQIGNDKPLAIVFERWYSPDLQVVVLSKHSDPRFGETTFTLSNIQTKEPDAALFQVPSDYTVKQDRAGRGARARMRMHRRMAVPPPGDPSVPPPPPDVSQPKE